MRSSLRRLPGIAAMAALAALVGTAASAQTVRTITDLWGGSPNGNPNGCTTYGPLPALGAFFNGGGFQALGGNAACGYTGFSADTTAAAGPLVASQVLPPVALDTGGSFGGSVAARAVYGALGVQAQGLLVGGAVNTSATSAAAAALFDDRLTASGAAFATGSGGFVRYVFRVDGRLAVPAQVEAYHPGYATLLLDYQHDGGPVFGDARLSAAAGGTGEYSALDGDPSTWTVGPGSIAGAGLFRSSVHAIRFGVAWELQVGLLAQTIGDGTADFLGTGRVVDVEFYDGAGQRIAGGIDLQSASGTDYLAAAVPEPATGALMALGALALAAVTRWRARVPLAAGPRARAPG